MILRERDTQEGLLVAVCDDDVLGETFETDGVSFTVTEEFYGGDEVDESEVVDSLTRASVANIVGTDAVTLAVENGFVDEGSVLELDSTKHAQFLRM
ncbi:DUF424 domain-containing protein [Haladaptatus caseinilyticus]|uniref:DUF424 domain-containing protein n=1 Tax=Haladaptatus caseinilyticus TaxID=2993314 RepID=UPI00224AC8B3|nr:DUF424 family protein [Haladaptatus caseinilyticus]